MRRAGDPALGLQAQVREMLVAAILDGQLPGGAPVPSSRELANELGVARNTVVIAYQQLADEGFLLSRERSGHFVNPAMVPICSRRRPTIRLTRGSPIARQAPIGNAACVCSPPLSAAS